MKLFITVLSLCCFTFASGQSVSKELEKSIAALDKALVEKDTVVILDLLHPNVTYGHSNGWVETRKEVINDLVSGYLVYERLQPGISTITTGRDWASVRMNLNVKGIVNYKPFEMQLYVLQVWKQENGKWRLIARQSAKL